MIRVVRETALVVCWAAALVALVTAADVTIPELGTSFEDSITPSGWKVFAVRNASEEMPMFDLSSSAAAHTGTKGVRIVQNQEPGDELSLRLEGPSTALVVGRRYRVSVWIRSTCQFNASLQWVYFPESIASGVRSTLRLNNSNEYREYVSEPFLPSFTTTYRFILALGEAPEGCTMDIDDFSVTVDAAVEATVLIGGGALQNITQSPFVLSVAPPANATAAYSPYETATGGRAYGAVINVDNPGPDAYSVNVHSSNNVLLEPGYVYYTSAWLDASENGVPFAFSWSSGAPDYAYVAGSGSVFAMQKQYMIYSFPAVEVTEETSAGVYFGFGGPQVPPGVRINIYDVTVVRVKPATVEPLEPQQEPFMAQDFEGSESQDAGLQLAFAGEATGGARATFNLRSTEAASSGTYGVRVTIDRQPDNEACDTCIQLLSAVWPDQIGATYILSFDLRASVAGAPFNVNFMAMGDKLNNSAVDTHEFNATTEFRRYSTNVTATRRADLHIAVHLGLARVGTVFDFDNVIITKEGGPSVPLTAGSTDFEPENAQPYVCLVSDAAAGSCNLRSTDNPYNGQYNAAITVTESTPDRPFAVQMTSDFVSLLAGMTHTVTTRIRATQPAPVSFAWNSGGPDYVSLPESESTVTVTTEWEIYTFVTEVRDAGMYRAQFGFAGAASGTVVYVDHIVATMDW